MLRRWLLASLAGLLVVALAAPAPATRAREQMSAPGAIRVVTSRTDSGAGSFRQALRDARAGDIILFDPAVFPPVNPASIMLLSALPALTQGNLTIDASNAGVILDGQYTPAGTDGLDIVSDRNAVRGLQIVRFHGNGISIYDGAQSNLIGGNWQLGRAPRGEGNIITLNGANGIELSGTGTNNNTISGNLIGLDIDGTQDFRVQTLALSPAYAQDRTVFIGTRYQGVLKSTDAGATWTPASTGLTILDVRTLAVSPNYASDRTLFAGTAAGGLFRSTNGGATWARIALAAAEDRDLLRVALSPNYRNDHTLFAAAHDIGLFLSTDGGDSWTAATTGLGDRAWTIIGVTLSPDFAIDRTVFANAWDHIYKSTDGGHTWALLNTPFTRGIWTVALSPAYATDRTLVVGIRDCAATVHFWRSTDGGSRWQALSGSSDFCDLRSMAISPAYASDRTLFAISDWDGILKKSTDGGATWTRQESSRYNRVVTISPAYAQDRTVFAGQYNGEIRRTSNGGATWPLIESGLTENGNHDAGIRINSGAQGNTVGGATPGERNVISNNGYPGVLVTGQGASHNRIIGNIIGATPSGTAPLGNDTEGITIEHGAHHNEIGGALPGEDNLISANAGRGVAIWHSGSDDNTVVANYIGTDINGVKPLGNHGQGVIIADAAQRTRVGGTTAAERNVISANGDCGVLITDANTTGNTISGNYVGVDASGTQRLGNYQAGIGIGNGARANTVGGATPDKRNIISANGRHGIGIWDPGTDENVVIGNYVGTDATGAAPLGNGATGIALSNGAQRNRIGGATPGERNVTADNGWEGISLWDPGTTANIVIGNYVGVDAAGQAPLGNHDSGIGLHTGVSANRIGGDTESERNVIAANKNAGIVFSQNGTSNNIVAGNIIGAGADGVTPLGNTWGVACWGAHDSTIRGNVIGGNRDNGVNLDGCDRMVVTGNWIGTGPDGVTDLGNGDNGISLFRGSQESVLGPNNVIAYNRGHGVAIWSATTQRNTVNRNAIYGNTKSGIYVEPGSNGELSAPAIIAAEATRVSGIAPVAGATVEIFSDEGAQGRIYEGSAISDADGRFVFNKAAGLSGPNFTATATDGAGNTSAFSRAFAKPQVNGGDSYEPDDACQTARSILADGSVQRRTFHQPGDVDWVALDARGGVEYLITGQPAGDVRIDLALELYDRCGGLPDESQDHPFTPGLQLQFRAPESGTYYLKLVNAAPATTGAHATYELSVRSLNATPIPGALILVAGRHRTNDPLQANIDHVAEQVYRLFNRNEYGDDRILFLATSLSLPGVDGLPSAASLQAAITQWARERVDASRALTLYMVDHGSVDRFYLDGVHGESASPAQINTWLAELEAARPGVKVNVIIESCRSGSFISGTQSLSKAGRVIITSTNDRELAWASRNGAMFSDHFVPALDELQSLFSSFQAASSGTRTAHPLQIAWLDDNGDGVANGPADGFEAARRGFNYPGTFNTISWPPYIAEAGAVPEAGGQGGVIRARVLDDAGVNHVWALIYPPSYLPPAPGETWGQDTLTPIWFTRQTGDWFSSTPQSFAESGAYRIVIYAEDRDNLAALPVTVTVRTGPGVYLPLVLRP